MCNQLFTSVYSWYPQRLTLNSFNLGGGSGLVGVQCAPATISNQFSREDKAIRLLQKNVRAWLLRLKAKRRKGNDEAKRLLGTPVHSSIV